MAYQRDLWLTIPSRKELIAVVNGFVENSLQSLSLDQKGIFSLLLATEEIFQYLNRGLPREDLIEISCADGGYYIQVDFSFPGFDLDLRAFNLTAEVPLEGDPNWDDLSLLLASRSVDRFWIDYQKKGNCRFSFRREKIYPKGEPAPENVHPIREPLSFVLADSQQAIWFSRLLIRDYQPDQFPGFFLFPEKLAGMIRNGRYGLILAIDSASQIAGGILFRSKGEKMMECYGPYVFSHAAIPNLSEKLIEECLREVARSHSIGMLNRWATESCPKHYFDQLGTFLWVSPDGKEMQKTALYRSLEEDLGTVIWTHPILQETIEGYCERMDLPRDIRVVGEHQQGLSGSSVFSAVFDRSLREVTLRPLVSGKDIQANLISHLKFFEREKIRNIYCQLDLGQPENVLFMPSLIQEGFKPKVLFPWAGTGDILLLQYEGEKA